MNQSPKKKYAIEIKRSSSPTVCKGFYLGCEDIGATHQFVVYPGKEQFSIGKNSIAMPLLDMMEVLRSIK